MILVVVLLWLVIWPIVMYYYFQEEATSHAHAPTRVEVGKETFTIAPTITSQGVRIAMNANGTMFILDDASAGQLIRKLRTTQLTVNSMQEVQKLEQ